MLKTVYCTLTFLMTFVHHLYGQDLRLEFPDTLTADELTQQLLTITEDSGDSYAALQFKLVLPCRIHDPQELQLVGDNLEAVVTSLLTHQGNRRGERMLVALQKAQELNYNTFRLMKKAEERPLTYATFEADKNLRAGIPLMRGLIAAGASPAIVECFISEDGKKCDMSLLEFWKREAKSDFTKKGYAEEDFNAAINTIDPTYIRAFDVPQWRSLYIYYELTRDHSRAPRSMLAPELKKEPVKKRH